MNNDTAYQCNIMTATVYNIKRSFEQEPEKWQLKLIKTSSTSTLFYGRYVVIAVYDDIPDQHFIVYTDAQHFHMNIDNFFDIIEGDEFIGEYVVPVFNMGQKEMLWRTFRNEMNCIPRVTELLRENYVPTYPFKNLEQRLISEAFGKDASRNAPARGDE